MEVTKGFQQSETNYKRKCMHGILCWNDANALGNRYIWIGFRAAVLQTRVGMSCLRDEPLGNNILRPTKFVSKNLSAEERYSNLEREVWALLHDLEKFHYYQIAREVSIITDDKPLVAVFKKDVATLSQKLQCILLRIDQYRVSILCKPEPDLFIADWLLRQNHDKIKIMK